MNPGTIVGGRFVVEQLAGSGGMGEVYRARDVHSGQPVAVKFVHAVGHAARFQREARVLAQLEHPAIVRYVAHGHEPAIFLVMEWLEGEDLGEALARGGLSVYDTVTLARRVADALAAAHVRGVVHRDIKPGNIFLVGGKIEAVKLLDFGVAAFAQGTRAMTMTGQVIGTLGYMAPEQASSGRDVTAKADVFSLGCVLFECIAGRPAFPGDRLMEVLAKILFAETPRPAGLRDDVPHALEDLVLRMLHKDPTDRPSLAAVSAELAALSALGGLPTDRSWRNRPASIDPTSNDEGPAVTSGERRLMAVVLADPSMKARARSTSPTLSIDEVRVTAASLGEDVAPFGGRLEILANGAIVVALTVDDAATDLAARAARVALRVHAAVAAPIVATFDRGDPTSDAHLAEVVQRASKMLGEPKTNPMTEAPVVRDGAPIVLDPVIAGLLDARFEVVDGAWGLELLGVRRADNLGRGAPCVGRDRELAMLQAVADECFGEPMAAAAVVTAPAGLGKTRLAHQFVRALRERDPDALVLSARGDPVARRAPFSLLTDLIARYADLGPDDRPEIRGAKLVARLERRLAPERAARVAKLLGEATGAKPAQRAPGTSPGLGPGDAEVSSAHPESLRRAFDELLAAETAKASVVLLLDDLQWADAASVRLVDGALLALRERPMLVLALARPDVQEALPGLFTDRRVHEIRLAELTPSSARRLATLALGDRVDRPTIDALVETAGGNPKVLEELIRAAALGERAPETAIAMAQARIERLEPEARRVLRAASALGAAAWPSAVAALLGDNPAPIGGDAPLRGATLADLARRELLVVREPSRFEGEVEYTFRNALVQEAAYRMLPDRDRLRAHQVAADFFEARGERDALVLAEHFELGGNPLGAVVWYLWAAEQAFARGDLIGVVARGERGVTCGASGAMLAELRLLQAEAIGWAGEPFTVLRATHPQGAHERHAETGLALSARGTSASARAGAELISACLRAGSTKRLPELAAALAATSPDTSAGLAHAFAIARAAIDLLTASLPTDAQSLLRWLDAARAEAVAEDAPTLAALVTWAGAAHDLALERPARLQREGPGLFDALEAAGQARHGVILALQLSSACVSVDAAATGLAWADKAAVIAKEHGLAAYADRVHSYRAVHLAALDRVAEAVSAALESVARGVTTGDRVTEGMARAHLAAVRFADDDPDAELEARAVMAERAFTAEARRFASDVLARVASATTQSGPSPFAATILDEGGKPRGLPRR